MKYRCSILAALVSTSVLAQADPSAFPAAAIAFLDIELPRMEKAVGIAHFHAVYGEHEISVAVESQVVQGNFPPRALRHVLEWAALHKQELLDNWELARQGKPLNQIAPLE